MFIACRSHATILQSLIKCSLESQKHLVEAALGVVVDARAVLLVVLPLALVPRFARVLVCAQARLVHPFPLPPGVRDSTASSLPASCSTGCGLDKMQLTFQRLPEPDMWVQK